MYKYKKLSYFKEDKQMDNKLKDLCDKFGVDYETALSYQLEYPELTREQVIIFLRPDLGINILGEIISIN